MRDPIGTMQGMCAKSETRLPQLTRRAPQRALKNRNLKCRVSSASLGANLLTVLLVLDSDKRNGGNSDLVHSRRLLIHHRPVDCGVKNRPDGIRLGPNPGSPAQPCQPFNTSHTIRASRTPWSFCLCLSFQGSPVDSHVRAGPHPAKLKSLAASQPDPLRLIKKVISLDLAQNKRTPCIPADRQWARLSPPPTVKSPTHSDCAYSCGAAHLRRVVHVPPHQRA